ncbi:uncharacterized protein LOC119389683 [Rhipicephalus sanguineus]|uniref:Uncharacterized protein n=1 Tax=Rhipicephalus sanguineus TaxID=34632 RepID=A0A9D4PW89_RHISA|nr:uncharacterized protein LOC119389683 [Rhipicephalus sanguineus]KAH7956955.1 hypothetical protein HPB52_013920 [Rhipicephalus sanguineus]
MATGSAPSFSGRRRSSRGISLLPSQDNFVKDLPTDIPEEDRLRILLRLCFKRTLATMADELDGFEDLHRKLLVQGLSMFDSSEDGGSDHLDKLLKLTTSKDDDDSDVLPAAVAAEHHELLKSLVAECKRWNEMLAEDLHFETDPPLADHDAAKIPVARKRHYDMLVESAERSRRKAIAILSTLPTGDDDEDNDAVAVGESTAELFDV